MRKRMLWMLGAVAAIVVILGVVKTLLYRPGLFGEPFSEALEAAMRGPSEWSPGERELFAGFTSLLRQCPF